MGKRLITFVVTVLALLSATQVLASYGSNLRHATKSGRIFNLETWDARLIWHSTFFGDDFRREFEERHIRINHLDDAGTQEFLEESRYRHLRGWDFFIGFYTKKDYKKFSSEPDSFWKIQLTTGLGETVHPDAIEMIPITPYERAMYPYLNRWSKAYRVTFPKVALGEEFSITINSVVGESTLEWKVR